MSSKNKQVNCFITDREHRYKIKTLWPAPWMHRLVTTVLVITGSTLVFYWMKCGYNETLGSLGAALVVGFIGEVFCGWLHGIRLGGYRIYYLPYFRYELMNIYKKSMIDEGTTNNGSKKKRLRRKSVYPSSKLVALRESVNTSVAAVVSLLAVVAGIMSLLMFESKASGVIPTSDKVVLAGLSVICFILSALAVAIAYWLCVSSIEGETLIDKGINNRFLAEISLIHFVRFWEFLSFALILAGVLLVWVVHLAFHSSGDLKIFHITTVEGRISFVILLIVILSGYMLTKIKLVEKIKSEN